VAIFDISLLFSSRCTWGCRIDPAYAGGGGRGRTHYLHQGRKVVVRIFTTQTGINKLSSFELLFSYSLSLHPVLVSFLNFTNKKFAVIGWNTVPFQPVLRIRIRDPVFLGSGMDKKSGFGIRDEHPRLFFWELTNSYLG
jgi:hypothetical protein